jgi:hypothetical protein
MILQVRKWLALNYVHRLYEHFIVSLTIILFPHPKKKKKQQKLPTITGAIQGHISCHVLYLTLKSPLTCKVCYSLICCNYFHMLNKHIKLSYKPFPLTVWYTLSVLVGLSIVTYIFALHSVFFCSLPTQNTLKVRNSIELSAN